MQKLYSLIKKLSQNEKRIVKMRLNASKKDSLLCKYFDLLAQQEEYDFELLLKKTKQPLKQTRSNLTFLYDAILKILRDCEISDNLKPHCRGELIDVITLKEKGLLSDAIFKANKLIDKSDELENLEVRYETLNELWNLHVLQGSASADLHDEIDHQINLTVEKLVDLAALRKIYRKLSMLYHEYFFVARNDEKILEVDELVIEANQIKKSSDRVRFIAYEIQSIALTFKNKLGANHTVRKSQLLLTVSSKAFNNNELVQIIVFGHIFTYLNIRSKRNEYKAFSELFIQKFHPSKNKIKDLVFNERYYKIYFDNLCYLGLFKQSDYNPNNIIKSFNDIIESGIIVNENLIFRILLNIIKTFLVNGNYDDAKELFKVLHNNKSIKKHSSEYIIAELLFVFLHCMLNNVDLVDSLLTSLKSRIHRNNLNLSRDQKIFLSALEDHFRGRFRNPNEYKSGIYNQVVFSLFIQQLANGQIEYLPISDEDYKPNSDPYFNVLLKNWI